MPEPLEQRRWTKRVLVGRLVRCLGRSPFLKVSAWSCAKGFELYLTIVGSSQQAPLHQRMRFVVAYHIEMAMRLAVLWTTVSSTAQSVLGWLPTKTFQDDAMGVMVAQFWEKEDQWSHLEDSCSRVYDLILGPSDDRVRPAIRMEEVARRL
jgi:hypothetical protein